MSSPQRRPTKVGTTKHIKSHACKECEPRVEDFLEYDDRISEEIRAVKTFSRFDDSRVFLHQQPTNVREEEPPLGVVGIGRRLAALVVHAMISSPVVDGTLVRDRVCEHEVDSHWKGCTVRTMRPQPVHAAGDTVGANRDKGSREKDSLPFRNQNGENEANHGCDVNEADEDDHRPVQIASFEVPDDSSFSSPFCDDLTSAT
jgi:hypothetical protein